MSFFINPLWCRLQGHEWHGGERAVYYREQDNQMVPSGYRIHLLCARCKKHEVRQYPGITQTRPIIDVSLPTDD